MTNQRPFGRRSVPQQQPLRATPTRVSPMPDPKPIFSGVSADQSSPYGDIAFARGNDQPPDWEQSTKWRLKMPWRQLALMASLCFGIASFVLPDSLNDQLQWVLYGLMAMSLCAALSKRLQS
jgi:hypothetical protein